MPRLHNKSPRIYRGKNVHKPDTVKFQSQQSPRYLRGAAKQSAFLDRCGAFTPERIDRTMSAEQHRRAGLIGKNLLSTPMGRMLSNFV